MLLSKCVHCLQKTKKKPKTKCTVLVYRCRFDFIEFLLFVLFVCLKENFDLFYVYVAIIVLAQGCYHYHFDSLTFCVFISF